jgi:hypothetical protein
MDPVITPTTSGAIAGLISLITANIDNPTELNAVGTAVEDIRLVHENVAGSDRATLYRLDTSSDSVSAPYVMASATAGLRWVAIAGYAVNQAVKLAGGVTALDPTDKTKALTWDLTGQTTGITLTLKPTSSTSQTLQYPNITATDTIETLGLAQTITALKTYTGGVTLTTAALTLTDVNVALSATTGTKFGTATTQKLAFFNANPVAQQTGDVATALTTFGLVTSPTIRATDALDGTFQVKNTADTTKQFGFSLGSNTTGIKLTLATAQTTAQTLNIPNITASDTVATLGLSQTWTGAPTFGAGATFSNNVTITRSVNGNLDLNLQNTNAGVSASSRWQWLNDAGNGLQFQNFGSGFASGGLANQAYLGSVGSGFAGMWIGPGNSSPVTLRSNGTDRLTIAGGGGATFQSGTTVTLSDSTDATSATTGALTGVGGASFGKNLIHAKGHGAGVTSTATAAGTTTLTSTSTEIQTFTGVTTQIVQFPAANLFGAGIAVLFTINNQSTGAVTPTRAGSDTFQGGGSTDTVASGTCKQYASDGVSKWLIISAS